ncbi:UDP-N-acetylmuramate dehydrogenase [Campylobacter geochelonis]|uniref:UDP-N-acetylmuramate dehydrogenase n=1 Tax=Campylobacter geochelonis TaxID=1780362 RepID=UPI0007709CAB|nr:UDP-N-acetylmuramate dehydrogenase [Campylobacter geochelonis]CZE45957.1 UDP-N-acetylenolpyruvoylglucosamine reductase [Campylobacter geochelonis]
MIVDFAKYSSVKIGQKVEVTLLNELNLKSFDGVIIGGANNILLSPNPPKLGILDKKFDFLSLEDDILLVGGACKSGKIYNFAKANDIANFEFLKSIPGTLGGLLTMNAGLMKWEICDNLISVKTSLGEFSKDELKFSYRKSEISGVILEARFRATHGFNQQISNQITQKRANQPKGASFGSCFTNPAGDYAGRVLEAVGLKGFRVGGAGFSEQHANFLINYGKASFDDAITLIKIAKKRVFEEFGIKLETEVVVL